MVQRCFSTDKFVAEMSKEPGIDDVANSISGAVASVEGTIKSADGAVRDTIRGAEASVVTTVQEVEGAVKDVEAEVERRQNIFNQGAMGKQSRAGGLAARLPLTAVRAPPPGFWQSSGKV